MKLSRILNEEVTGYRFPDWLDHVKTTPYSDSDSDSDYDQWFAYKFDIPGPIDILDDSPGGIMVKIKDVVITFDPGPWPQGGAAPLNTSENPLDNIIDEFEKDEKVIPYQIEGYLHGRPFYGEFDYVETGGENVTDPGYSDLWLSAINGSLFDNIIDQIAWPVLTKHYETHR